MNNARVRECSPARETTAESPEILRFCNGDGELSFLKGNQYLSFF